MLSHGYGLLVVPLLLIFFGITIFVHEFGHYIVARWCGMAIDTFSIGFGPAIWKRRHKGTLYKIGCIPFGGYVALPQLDPTGMSRLQGPAADGTPAEALPAIAPWKKIAVSVAGALGNVLLAVAIAWIVFWAGMPGGPAERAAILGFVDRASPSYAAGLRAGDEVLAVNGRPVGKFSDFRMELALHAEVTLKIRAPDGNGKTVTLPTEKGDFGEMSLNGIEPPDLCEVLGVQPGMSAAAAGVKDGDIIASFADEPVYSRVHLSDLVAQHRDRPSDLVVLRGADGARERVTLRVTPAFDETTQRPRIGITFNLMAVEENTIVHPPPGEQLRTHSSAIFRFLKALVTPKQSKAASRAVGGPVAIMVSYWAIVRTSLMLAVFFTGFLNVNLAILNLLPIPVLDGGHICFSLWEWIAGKPLSARVVNALVNVFAVLLIGLMVLLSVRDVDRFTSWGQRLRKMAHRAPAGTNHVESAEAATSAVPAAAGTNR